MDSHSPNTDAALYLGIAYYWIEKGTYDKEYVDTHVVGFDKFKAYVMGDEDGIPKPQVGQRNRNTKPNNQGFARAWLPCRPQPLTPTAAA